MTPAQAQPRTLAEANQQMVSRREVESLLERETRPDSPVLSVYLDTDQSNVGNVIAPLKSCSKYAARH